MGCHPRPPRRSGRRAERGSRLPVLLVRGGFREPSARGDAGRAARSARGAGRRRQPPHPARGRARAGAARGPRGLVLGFRGPGRHRGGGGGRGSAGPWRAGRPRPGRRAARTPGPALARGGGGRARGRGSGAGAGRGRGARPGGAPRGGRAADPAAPPLVHRAPGSREPTGRRPRPTRARARQGAALQARPGARRGRAAGPGGARRRGRAPTARRERPARARARAAGGGPARGVDRGAARAGGLGAGPRARRRPGGPPGGGRGLRAARDADRRRCARRTPRGRIERARAPSPGLGAPVAHRAEAPGRPAPVAALARAVPRGLVGLGAPGRGCGRGAQPRARTRDARDPRRAGGLPLRLLGVHVGRATRRPHAQGRGRR